MATFLLLISHSLRCTAATEVERAGAAAVAGNRETAASVLEATATVIEFVAGFTATLRDMCSYPHCH